MEKTQCRSVEEREGLAYRLRAAGYSQKDGYTTVHWIGHGGDTTVPVSLQPGEFRLVDFRVEGGAWPPPHHYSVELERHADDEQIYETDWTVVRQ